MEVSLCGKPKRGRKIASGLQVVVKHERESWTRDLKSRVVECCACTEGMFWWGRSQSGHRLGPSVLCMIVHRKVVQWFL